MAGALMAFQSVDDLLFVVESGRATSKPLKNLGGEFNNAEKSKN
jgi:hypothetical protein